MSNATTDDLRARAHSDAAMSVNYIVLVVASCLIATLGLLENSVAVIIGAMIIAPLIGPIQAFAYAGLDGDAVLLRKSLSAAAIGALLAIGISWAIGIIVAFPSYGSEVTARTRPNVLDLAIAIAAGGVAGYARIRPSVANTVAGTAIAVALMPPLCVVGLLLGARSWNEAFGAVLLFGTNFLGIALACMIVYVISGRFQRHNRSTLIVTIVVAVALTFPLGASFLELTRESKLEADIRNGLMTNTVTFKRTQLVRATFDWNAHPLQARLDVRSGGEISPAQVHDLEKFLTQRIGRPVALIIDVSRFTVVTDATPALSTAGIGP
jgi:uncharacterized hydrophobic protein (TIGR00271 family)